MSQGCVLVVDDSAFARRFLVHQLREEGYDLAEVTSGEEALEYCAESPPDVIVLDVEMPGIDGYETLRRLQASDLLQEIPVLFVTGRGEAEDVAEGLRLGAHDYLRKPFERIELVARVRSAMRMKVLQDALRDRNAELERIASVDALTGLFNRRVLEEHGSRSVSRLKRHGGSMGVGLLDIDGFKAVNDTHGHATGDAVLVEVGRRLAARTRLEDLLGRWGGEEFVVLAGDTDAAGIAEVCERMREEVAAAPVVVAGVEITVTISAGWSAGRDGVPLEQLLRGADRGLYRAKADGRNVVRGEEHPAPDRVRSATPRPPQPGT